MKKISIYYLNICAALLCSTNVYALQESFVSYSFEDSIPSDDSGKWQGFLCNNARIIKIGENHVLFTGENNGYMDLGESAGHDFFTNVKDFSISMDIRSQKDNNLNSNGNFICSFSSLYPVIWGNNQNDVQYIFIGAKSVSYTINNKNYGSQESTWLNKNITTDKWQNITYVQKGNTGKLYIDGILVSENDKMTITPDKIAENLKYNWLGRSCWGNDSYLKNCYIDNFKIYHNALAENEIKELSEGLDIKNTEFSIFDALEKINLDNLDLIKEDIVLPSFIDNYKIEWVSSNTDVIDTNGKVTRPGVDEDNCNVILTASITYNNICLKKDFNVSVMKEYSDSESVSLDYENLNIPEGYLNNAKWDIPLKYEGTYESNIEWTSSNTEYLSDNGKINKLSDSNSEKVKVILTALIKKGEISKEKHFEVCMAYPEADYSGYLFAYFEGSGEGALQEHLRFGASADAIVWKALNNNNPIIKSDTVSLSGGIRDPHILRTESGNSFYMVATDMYVHKYGWTENPGIVLMKSDNLTDWSHSYINLKETYPENFGDAYWVWAPQTIYDPSASKYMIYFTLKRRNSSDLITYYAYANEDFTAFESEPKVLFSAKYGSIDNDIIYKDGLWHLFYKGNTKDEYGTEFINGIQQATSETLHGEWKEDFIYLDIYAGKTPVEGSGIFKLNNSDKYILMYDLYTSLKYEYQISDDLFDFGTTSYSFIKDFNPRHGTVIGITKDEAIRLNNRWGGIPEDIISDINNKHQKDKNINISINGNNVKITGNAESKIEIYNIKGWLIKKAILDSDNSLNLTLEPGIYLVNKKKIIIK